MTDMPETHSLTPPTSSGNPVRWAMLAVTLFLAASVAVGWLKPAWFASGPGRWIPLIVVAAALGWVLVVAATARFLGAAGRVLLAALAIYGLIGVLLGARDGHSFGALLHGAGLWHALPWFLHAASIGAFLVLPVAAIIHVVRAGVAGFRPAGGGPGRELHRAVVLTLCTALALSTWPQSAAAPAPAAQVSAPAAVLPPPPPTSSAAHEPDAVATAADQFADRITLEDWNIDARASTLPPGADAALTFVRDQLRYEPYPGVLRGVTGAYTARAANAADRSLLLAHLLARQGIPVQFAIGTLDSSQREQLWRHAFDSGPTPPSPRAGTPRDASAGPTLRQRILARADHDYAAVRAALGDGLAPVSVPARDQVLSEMNPHVWVQAKAGERWIDLDPSFPDATAGKAYAQPERTVAELPDDLYQQVTVSVVVEQLEGTALQARPVLRLKRRAIDLVDHQIFVGHTPGQGSPLGSLGNAMTGNNAWTPLLWINGETTQGELITIREASAAAAPQPAAPATKPSGSGLSGLGGALDVLSSEPPAQSSPSGASAAPPGGESRTTVFVAEWLEFDITGPGGLHDVSRRSLVDRGGAAWRVSAPLDGSRLQSLERGPQGPYAMMALHNVWLSAGAHNLADFSDALQDLATEQFRTLAQQDAQGAAAHGDAGFDEAAWPVALRNFSWMVWTDHVLVPLLNDSADVRLFTASPRIAIFTDRPGPNSTVQPQSDLRRDVLRVIVADDTKTQLAAEKKLRYGILEGALEHEAMAARVAVEGADASRVESTSSRLADSELVVLRKAQALGDLIKVAHPESVARLTAALATHSIVAGMKALDADAAWWELSDGTGDTASIGASDLRASKGPGYNPNYSLPEKTPPKQADYRGKDPITSDGRTKGEKFQDGYQRRNEIMKRRAERFKSPKGQEAANNANNLQKSSRNRGGIEYAALITLIFLAAAAKFILIGLATEYAIQMTIQAFQAD